MPQSTKQAEGDSALHGKVGTSQGDAGGPGSEGGSTQELPKGTPTEAKLSESFKPNEPDHKSGVGDDGNPNDTLSLAQVERAATEALLSLRPQPSGLEVRGVLNLLGEKDPENDKVKEQFKSAKDAGAKAVELLNSTRKAEAQTAGRTQDSHAQSAEGGRTAETSQKT